jgi:type IV secretory pathway TraG/TraD family ATPase VirD4
MTPHAASETHNPADVLTLGETDFRRSHRRFGLLAEDRTRHLWLLGKTGSGKSTLIANLVVQDLAAGAGVVLLDPHGDLVESVLPFVPPERTNRVLLFSPEDREHPVSFNVFRAGRRPHADPALLASHLVPVFRTLWADSWGPRLEHVLRNAVLAVAPDPRATLLFLYRFLTEERLRAQVVAALADPVVRQFWTKEFPSYSRSLQSEALAPALNKLGAFVAHPTVRNIVAQERSRLDLVELMEERDVLLANLSSGKIGEDASRLLGGLLLVGVQLAAMERPRGGPRVHLYADEFQNFVSGSVATMLSESRKFGLGLTLSHQYLGQLPEAILGAVLGNVGSCVIFRLGGADAATLEAELAPFFSARDLQSLEAHHAVVRLLVRGCSTHPFSARMLPPPAMPADAEERREKVRRQSRLRFARSVREVEASLARSLAASR